MEAAARNSAQAQKERLGGQGPLRLVVVEDDPALRILLKRMLASRADVRCVPSGAKALELLAQLPEIDLVISDLNLGDMSALELLAQLEEKGERWRHRFVICTGGSVGARQSVALGASGVPVLRKPFRADDLRAMVDGFIGRPKPDSL